MAADHHLRDRPEIALLAARPVPRNLESTWHRALAVHATRANATLPSTAAVQVALPQCGQVHNNLDANSVADNIEQVQKAKQCYQPVCRTQIVRLILYTSS